MLTITTPQGEAVPFVAATPLQQRAHWDLRVQGLQRELELLFVEVTALAEEIEQRINDLRSLSL